MGSATLVAVTLTVCWVLFVAGAVYKPVLDSVPTAGLNDQVTPVLLLPVTVVVNCWVCETDRLADVGLICTNTGTSVIVAVADLLGSATLVAVTVIVWPLATGDGAVYKPVLDSVPTAGVIDQVTLVLLLPVTVVVNC